MPPSGPSSSPTPQPRSGLLWIVDQLLGPGASRTEQLRVVAAAAAGVLLGMFTVDAPAGPTLVLAVLTADLTGGVMAHLNPAGKRWQHRPGRTWWQHLGFVALHGVHLALFIALFRAMDWLLFAYAWALLLAGAAAVLLSPPPWQRGVALTAVLGGLLALQRLVPPVQEAAWFIPLLYTKLLIAYLPAPLADTAVSRDPEP